MRSAPGACGGRGRRLLVIFRALSMHHSAPHTSTMALWQGSQMGYIPGKGGGEVMESECVGSLALPLVLCLLTLELPFIFP